MSIRIVTDSTADYPQSIRNRVTIVPLTIHFGDEEFVDGVTITHKEFYDKLTSGTVLPTTSQATPEAFDQVFREAAAAGDSVIVITIASQLSGTCQSATIAAADYPGKVFVVDSQNVAIGAGILVQHALALVDAGVSAAEIAAELTKQRDRIRLIAVLDTLEYLKRGGRISKTVAFAGGLLSIKPVISVQDGVIHSLSKARARQGGEMLLKEIENAGGVDTTMPALLGYTGNSDELLQKFITDCAARELPLANLPYTVIGSVVGTHAGPGAYAVAFFVK